MAIKTSGIDHIHLNIPSLDRFLDVMTKLFEFEPGRASLVHSILAYNASMRLADAPDGQPFLDVFEPASPDSGVAHHMKERGTSVSYISFRVDDIEEAAAHAAQCGLYEVSRVGFPGLMKQVQFDTMDLLGFHLELVEYAPGHRAAIAEIQRRLAAGESVEGLTAARPF